MLSVGGQEVSPVCLRIPGGRKVGQPGEDQVSKVEGILCDQNGLADAFQMAELRDMFEERGTDARRLQERRDPFLQVLRSQEDRKMPGDVQEQFRNDPLLPPQADPGEEAALLQALLDLLGGTDQTLGIRPGRPTSMTSRSWIGWLASIRRASARTGSSWGREATRSKSNSRRCRAERNSPATARTTRRMNDHRSL